jgi:hypothetical protein
MADNNLLLFCLVLLLLTYTESTNDKRPIPKLRIYTVATEETDGLERLLRSAQVYDLSVNVLGMGERWNGGDTRYEAGGGQKIRLLRDALVEYRNDDDSMVLFIDAYVINCSISHVTTHLQLRCYIQCRRRNNSQSIFRTLFDISCCIFSRTILLAE